MHPEPAKADSITVRQRRPSLRAIERGEIIAAHAEAFCAVWNSGGDIDEAYEVLAEGIATVLGIDLHDPNFDERRLQVIEGYIASLRNFMKSISRKWN